MVEVYGYDIARLDIDYTSYLYNEEAIDKMALKAGKHWFMGLEVVEGKDVAVFLFPTTNGNQRVLELAESITALLDQVVA